MRTILITGATGNMGSAMVKRFLAAGDAVTGTILPHESAPAGLEHPLFEAVPADLLNEDHSEELVKALVAKRGGIDVAILTVGGFAMGDILSTRSKDLLRQYQLNVETTYHIARPVFEQMMKTGKGRIFLVGSRPGADMKAGKGMTAYALAKSLIFRLAELMNEEAKGTDLVTTVIIPSTIDTPQNRKAMPDADVSKWVKPEEIAEAVFFYCSGEAAALREPLLKIYGGS